MGEGFGTSNIACDAANICSAAGGAPADWRYCGCSSSIGACAVAGATGAGSSHSTNGHRHSRRQTFYRTSSTGTNYTSTASLCNIRRW